MNDHYLLNATYKYLEFDLIVNKILHYSILKNPVKKRLLKIVPDNLLNHYEFLNAFKNNFFDPRIESLSFHLSKIGEETTIQHFNLIPKGAILDISSLHKIGLFIEASLKIEHISLFERYVFFNNKTELSKLKLTFLKELRLIVDENGEIDFSTHPLIIKISEELRSVTEIIRKKIQLLSSDLEFKNILRFDGHDIIRDKFVMAIRSDAYNSSLGQIIDRSETGQSLYIEPFDLKELNFKRIELLLKQEEIIFNISKNLSAIIASHFDFIQSLIESIEEIDYYLALTKFYHSELFSIPELSSNLEIDLKDHFHPLINNPVKNSFNLNENKSGLIISGPNTGGKTAFLKSLGLTILCKKHGFPIAAKESSIGHYKDVIYIGPDEQSLNDGLSSFSSEVKILISLFEMDLNQSLIIIDEIFNSTSSKEASLLAYSIIKELNSRFKCHIAISTHHDDLKKYFHQDLNYFSAHVGFSKNTNKPTYKLHLGEPGESYALKIAKNHIKDDSLSEAIFNRMDPFLCKQEVNYENLLASLQEKESLIDIKLSEILKRETDLINLEKSTRASIELKKSDELQKFRIKFDEAFSDLEKFYEKIRSQEISTKNALHNHKTKLLNEVEPTQSYSPNLSYHSKKLGRTVKVLEINKNKNEALVQAGNIKMKLPLSDIMEIKSKVHNISPTIEMKTQATIEIDCRGMRLEEFKDEVFKHLTNLSLEEIPFLNIIHGHGDGVLKKWLREFLRTNKDYKIDHVENDSNDGQTRIVLA